jgi:hypothetical protein
MSTTARREVALNCFDDKAGLVLRTARRVAHRHATLSIDTRCLLKALADDVGLWPNKIADAMTQVRDAPIGTDGTEVRTEIMLEGLAISDQLELVLNAALANEPPAAVSPEGLLKALAEAPGTDATQMFRAIRGVQDPWAEVRPYISARERAEPFTKRAALAKSPGTERLVGLLYLLMRDEVPFGRIAKIVQQLEQGGEFSFTNGDGEALARQFADRLLG